MRIVGAILVLAIVLSPVAAEATARKRTSTGQTATQGKKGFFAKARQAPRRLLQRIGIGRSRSTGKKRSSGIGIKAAAASGVLALAMLAACSPAPASTSNPSAPTRVQTPHGQVMAPSNYENLRPLGKTGLYVGVRNDGSMKGVFNPATGRVMAESKTVSLTADGTAVDLGVGTPIPLELFVLE